MGSQVSSRFLIEEFVAQVSSDMIARDNQGNDVWPAPVVNLDAALSAISPIFLRYAVRLIEEQGTKRAANALQYPSGVAELMYLMMHRPDSNDEADTQVLGATTMLNVIAELRPDDPFCSKGSSWLPRQAPNADAFVPIDSELSSDIGMLCALLTLYCEYTFFAFVGFGKEVHGPYRDPRIASSSSVLVRDYFGMNSPIWNFSRSSNIQSIRLTTRYSDSQLTIDFMGRLNSHGSLPGRATHASISVNGIEKPMTGRSVQRLTAKLSLLLDEAHRETLSCDEHELFLRLVRTIFAFLSPLGQGRISPTPEEVEEITDRYFSESYRHGISRSLKHISTLPLDSKRVELADLLRPGSFDKWRY